MALTLVTPSANAAKPVGITLAHGLGKDGWAGPLMAWGNANTAADWSSLSYEEGIFGWGHAKHVKALQDLLHEELEKCPAGLQHGVGHSNGCRLFLEAMAADNSIKLDDLHLVAAWSPRDCDKSGLNLILRRRQAKRVFLYTSKKDTALGWNYLLPQYWGFTLGKDGPTNLDASPFLVQWPNQLSLVNDHDQFIHVYDNSMTHCSWVNDPERVRQMLSISPGVL